MWQSNKMIIMTLFFYKALIFLILLLQVLNIRLYYIDNNYFSFIR